MGPEVQSPLNLPKLEMQGGGCSWSPLCRGEWEGEVPLSPLGLGKVDMAWPLLCSLKATGF